MDFIKTIRNVAVILVISYANAYAVDYKLSMDWQRDKQNYTQKVSIIDNASNGVIKEITISNSYKKEASLFRRGNSPFAFSYTEPKSLKGPKGLVQIINLNSLSISHEIVIDKMTQTKVRHVTHNYMSVTKDGKHLIAQIGKGKNQRLVSIDGATGEIIKSIGLGKKKTLVKNGTDMEYIWIRFAKKSKGNILKIYQANTLEYVRDIILFGRLISVSHYKNYIFIKEKISNSKEPKKNKYNLKIVNIDNKKLYDDFSSSELPFEFIFKQRIIYLIGRSLKAPKHLKVVKFEDEIFTDISLKTIDAIPEVLKGYQNENEQTLIVFGKSAVVKFNILEPNKSNKIEIPFKIEGGIVSDDWQKIYVLANFGAKIGLADFEQGKFIGSNHTGSKAKKVGNVLFNLAAMAATAPTGYVVTPGFKLSNNTLMLSSNQKFLFAVNTKTNDVSVFNAEDLSNKEIYPTGKHTFKIVHARHLEDLPMVILSKKMASFFDTKTGLLIHQLTYDNFIKVTDKLQLIYQINGKQSSISIWDKDSW